ncbi:MAG: DUF5057 domain-containing protein [Lachnospiraceae bacterium]|nr:DUF5057 domain-containing protein [Lachnospiraceae bacterium]
MMKKNTALKRIGMGFAGITMAAVMFLTGTLSGVQEAQAVKVFDGITQKFPVSDGNTVLKILEITPSSEVMSNTFQYETAKNFNKYSEMGYFLRGPRSPKATPSGYVDIAIQSPTSATYGMALTERTFNALNDNPDLDTIHNYWEYGLIKDDRLGASGVEEYPIFAYYGGTQSAQVFSDTYKNTTPYLLPDTFILVSGTYSLAELGDDNAYHGAYNIADGYTMGDDGGIYQVTQETVSGNTVDTWAADADGVKTVSENAVEKGYTEDADGNFVITVKTLVTDIRAGQELPTSSTGVPYITRNDTNTGNLNFTAIRIDEVPDPARHYYLGYSTDDPIYMSNDQNYRFFSNDAFREFVLGSRIEYANSKIEYNVKPANEVNTDDIDNANLIYISSSSNKDAGVVFSETKDLKPAVMAAIFDQEVNDHKAVMMDYKAYSGGKELNVDKLCRLLWLNDSISSAYALYGSDLVESTDSTTGKTKITLADPNNLSDEFLKYLKDNMIDVPSHNFVNGNVYVYDHHVADYAASRSKTDAGDLFCTGDFSNAYTSEVAANGFAAVLEYISTTNKNSTDGQMPTYVSPAVAIQYILCSDGNPLTLLKETLHILEIEPVNSFLYNPVDSKSEEYGYLADTYKKNRDEFAANYLSEYYQKKIDDIRFTSMNVDEFNGHNEDLIETYDIIYIGVQRGDLYYEEQIDTRKELDAATSTAAYEGMSVTAKVKKSLPQFRITTGASTNTQNTAMYGNVYYSQGSMTRVNEARMDHFMTPDTKWHRYGSRDITKDKLSKLEAFLDNGNLILCDKELMTTTDTAGAQEREVNPTAVKKPNDNSKTDKGRMDNSSYMYELFEYALGYRYQYKYGQNGEYVNSYDGTTFFEPCQNLISCEDVKRGIVAQETLEKYILKQRVSLTMTQVPQAYDYELSPGSLVIDPTTVKYLTADSNGHRYLTFGFVINSEISGMSADSTFRPHLYLDINNDGKYSKETEDITDVTIRVKSSGAEADRDPDDSEYYALKKDVEYELKRAVDDDYSGYLAWKFAVDHKTVSAAHASVQGNTVAKPMDGDEVIKILQINHTSSTLNLETQLYTSETNHTRNNGSRFGKYLNKMPGYKVYIDTIDTNTFQTDFNNKYTAAHNADPSLTAAEFGQQYFDEYVIDAADNIVGASMIVLGFGDNYAPFGTQTATDGLQAYIENGNPVLLTHDFIMFNTVMPDSRHFYALRDLVGMDKYGVTDYIIPENDGSYSLLNRVKTAPANAMNSLFTNVNYTRAADGGVFEAVENTGKTPAYEPGSLRNTLSAYKAGDSVLSMNRYMYNDSGAQTFVKYNNRFKWGSGNLNAGTYTVDKLNEGQLTSFPYAIPASFKVATTHNQYFELDMDADDDNDGESDCVVWYTLGTNTSGSDPFGVNSGGVRPADAYYIYNKGNVTYTGAGHSSVTAGSEYEAQLFVNTLFAAYKSKFIRPRVGFYENHTLDAPEITNIAVPYDGNVTQDETVNSSVVKDADGNYKYKFVDPNTTAGQEANGTIVYLRLEDNNFVRGSKELDLKFFLQTSSMRNDTTVASVTTNAGNRTTEWLQYADGFGNTDSDFVVDVTDQIRLFEADTNGALTTELSRNATTNKFDKLHSGLTYAIYLPMNYLNTNADFTIYAKVHSIFYSVSAMTGKTIVTNPSDTDPQNYGVEKLRVTKTSLLRLN